MSPKICIGTVQFGLPYGITNRSGKVSEKEVAKILRLAQSYSLNSLDTAQAYGDAEAVLGRNLPFGHQFQIVSKLPSQSNDSFSVDDILAWEKNFLNTCERLHASHVDAFLLHDVGDLRKIGSEHLLEWLLSLKSRGLVNRLGASIYEASDLDCIPDDLLDLVQLPLSLYDQRLLIDGTIHHLRSKACAVHIRSVYLQGLLLSPASSWPSWVYPEAKAHHASLEKLAMENGISLLDLALGFASAQANVESVVVGVCSVTQLSQLKYSWSKKVSFPDISWEDWALDDPSILDPRAWPK